MKDTEKKKQKYVTPRTREIALDNALPLLEGSRGFSLTKAQLFNYSGEVGAKRLLW